MQARCLIDNYLNTGHNLSGIETMNNQMNGGVSTLSAYVDRLQRRAHYSFTTQMAAGQLGLSVETLGRALRRLRSDGRIRRIQNEFYTIVPLEHADAGNIPSDWFIADLMRFIELPYYVGGLTAAAYHGAAHQQPQEFQIVIPVVRRPIRSAPTRIRFLRYGQMNRVHTQLMKTYTGSLPVSTPEYTALDLIRFQKMIGGLDAVMTVLKELGEKIAPHALFSAVRHEPVVAHVQRLGWMLERIGLQNLAKELGHWLDRRNPSVAALNGALRTRKGPVDPKWRLILNDSPEGE
jgi:predicted transcriptional regulator of viral defense system